MTVFRRELTVSFYRIAPGDAATEFPGGQFPAQTVLKTVEGLDLASGEYHLATDLFSSQNFCVVHSGPLPLLGAYNKDMYAALVTELKGELAEVPLREGEGVVDASYMAFFPGNVAGLLRTSLKAPGQSAISTWLSRFGGWPCRFRAIPDTNKLAQLRRPDLRPRSLVLRARTRAIESIRPYSPSVAEALWAAARLSPSSKVGVEFGVTRENERQQWWDGTHSVIVDLLDVIPDLETARVELKGAKPINLKRAYIAAQVDVETDGSKRVRPLEAALALSAAYKQSLKALLASEGEEVQGEQEGATPDEVDRPSDG